MKNLVLYFFRMFRNFGMAAAVQFAWKMIFGKFEKIQIPGYGHPISMRKNSTDLPIFYEVFLINTYKLKEMQPKWIIDAGANIGLTTAYLAHRYPAAKIISIEPDAKNFELLKANTSTYPNVICLQGALWKNQAFLEIRDMGYGECGYMVEEVPASSASSLEAFSLPQLMKTYSIPIIDILKIDIEGSEKEVFEGAEAWLPQVKCLMIELHDYMKKGCSQSVLRALTPFNFSLEIRDQNLIFYNENSV